jgi:hypothetical protein
MPQASLLGLTHPSSQMKEVRASIFPVQMLSLISVVLKTGRVQA